LIPIRKSIKFLIEGVHMEFCKYHALGNDYIVIDAARNALDLTPERIRMICDRHFGIGSDGILYGPLSRNGGIIVRIYNPDGSEAEKSGNGIRIFSKYLLDEGYEDGPSFSLLTPGGEVVASVIDTEVPTIEVDMGPVTFRSSEIPVLGEEREVVEEAIEIGGTSLRMTCLSIGNPHCVISQKTVEAETAKKIGPVVERHYLFPKRINIQFLQVLDRRNIKIEIWERGAGYTLASGSSGCAAFAAAYRLGHVERNCTVHMQGGELAVRIDDRGRIHQRGPVQKVMEGSFTAEFV
jgi:diaminopimelate epimerase